MTPESTFPFAGVVELLELGAALYGHARANGAAEAELSALVAVGLDLVEALDLAQRSERGMVEYTVALELAEDASDRLCRLLVRSGGEVERFVKTG